MGYSHYWQSRGFTPEQWAQLQESARVIFARARRAGIGIAGWNGRSAIEYGPDRLAFNGREPHAFETCAIASGQDYSFCKTGREPYDAAVVAVLIVAARIAPHAFEWRSDGDAAEHAAGERLARDLPVVGATGGAAVPYPSNL